MNEIKESITRINEFENNLASFLSIYDKSQAEVLDFFKDTSNYTLMKKDAELIAKKFHEIRKEFNKKQKAAIDNEDKHSQEKNNALINLQNKLSDSTKQLSTTQLELAKLKNMIAIQEAQNAELTIENLNLKTKLGDGQLIDVEKTSQYAKYQEEAKLLKSKIEYYEEQLAEKQKESSFVSTNNSNLENELSEAKKSNSTMQNELIKLRTELDQMKAIQNESTVSLQAKLKKEVLKKKQAQNALNECLTQKSQRIDQVSQQKIKMVTDECDKAKKKIKELELLLMTNQSSIKDYERKIGILEKKNSELHNANNELKNFDYQKKLKTLCNKLCSSFEQHRDLMIEQIQNISNKFENYTSSALQMGEHLAYIHGENERLVSDNQKERSLLNFAAQAMAKLSGVSISEAPSITDMLENPQKLESFYNTLYQTVAETKEKEKIAISNIAQSMSPIKQRQAPYVMTTLNNINDLMHVMNDQMQEEHNQLMSTIADQEMPSFRNIVHVK